MNDKHEVIIDGVVYAPAVTAVPGVDDMMQAIFESYMGGAFGRWNEGDNARTLWVEVNEDGEGETLEEIAASIARLMNGEPK